jgi:hypothetical protein
MFVLSELQVLLCGRDNLDRGCLEHWRFDATVGAMQFQSSYHCPHMDFVGVVYDAASRRIALLDCVGQRIVGGAWDGGSSLGSLSLTTLVASGNVPFLLEAPSLVLVPGRTGRNASMNLVRWPMRRGSAFAEWLFPATPDAPLPAVTYGIDAW